MLKKILLAVGVLVLVEVTPYFGNSLAFTNSLIWDKKDAYRYIADSNIDWGQNEEAARRASAREYPDGHFEPRRVRAGINIIRLNDLVGLYEIYGQGDPHAWVRENLEPQRHLLHTHLVFDISEEDISRMKEARRTAR